MFWSREATELLIDLYEKHEEALEDPRKKKKDVWMLITGKINEAGYMFSQSKVEGKWRSLLASHKDLRISKSRTGQKRKSFQYFEKIDQILSKRHDVNPPFTSGSEIHRDKTSKFSTKTNCTASAAEAESSSTGVSDNMEAEEEAEITRKSASARRRQEKRKMAADSNSVTKVIEFLQDMEKQRKEDREERERKRDERAKEKNDLFREFLAVLSKQN